MNRFCLLLFCALINCTLLLSCATTAEKPVEAVFYEPKKPMRPSDLIVKLANENDGWAQMILATLYSSGIGDFPKDNGRYLNWLQKAADNEIAYAQYMLALHYASGDILPKNSETAFYWLNKSADHGFMMAQMHMVTYYGVNEQGPQDFNKAYFWCLAASYNKPVTTFNLVEQLAPLKIATTSEDLIIKIVAQFERMDADFSEARQGIASHGLCDSFKARLNPMVASDVIEAAQRWQPAPQRPLM